MSLTTPLATPQYTKLRSGSYAGDSYVTLFSDRVVFKCLLNTDLTAPGSWAVVAYNGVTIGSYTDVRDGMEVLISATSNIKEATYVGRVRAEQDSPTPTTLPLAESSLNFSIGATIWVLNNHVPQYRLSRPSTNDPATAVELIDYNITFQELAPQTVGLDTGYIGRVNPATGYLRLGFDASTSYAGTSGATVASWTWNVGSASIIAGSASSQRIIVDFAHGEYWCSLLLLDSGGRTSLRWFAVRAHSEADPPNVYGSNISITGNLDQGWTASVPFFAGVDDVLPNAFAILWRDYEMYGGVEGGLFGGGNATITNKSLTSNVATLTAASHSFQVGQKVIVIIGDTTFDGTFTITATTTNTFSYAKTHANVGSTSASGYAVVNAQNVDFVGWWQQEDDPATYDNDAGVLETANFQFTGVGARMVRMTSQQLGFTLDSTPTLWGEIVNLTPWRAMLHFIQRYTTVANICNITFDSTDNTYLFPALSAMGGTAMESVRGIASQVRAKPIFAPWGAVLIATSVGQLTTGERALLPTIASWDMQDIISPGGISRSIEPLQTIGKVDADGGGYNTTLGQVIVYTARAPGIAQGDGSGSGTLSAQIMPASATSADTLDKLRQYVGNELLIENNQEYLDVDHPDGYVGLRFLACEVELYQFTLDVEMVGENNVNRIVYTISALWTIDNVTINYSSEGLRTVKTRYHRVTPVGALGDDTTQIIPAPGEIAPIVDPGLPSFDFEPIDILFPDEPPVGAVAPPPDGAIAGFKGQELLVTAPTTAWWLKNFVTLSSPTALNITPSDLADFTITQPALSPFYSETAIPAYLMVDDAVDTKVYYTPNAATLGAAWTAGDTTTGEYAVLRATCVDGSIVMYTPSGTVLETDTGSYDFAVDGAQNWTYQFVPTTTNGGGSFTGSGWLSSHKFPGTMPPSGNQSISIQKNFAATITVNSVRVVGVAPASKSMSFEILGKKVSNGLWQSAGGYPSQSVSGAYDFTIDITPSPLFNVPINALHVYLEINDTVNTFTLTEVDLTGTGFPIPDGVTTGGSAVAYSNDNGATWDSVVLVGNTPGDIGGFDVSRASETSFGAADHTIYKATSLGGSYSLYYTITGGASEAVCVVIPYFTWAGVKQTTSADPDIIIALDVADGSSRTLLWLEGGASSPGSIHDITPVAGMTFDNSNCVTSSYQHHIAVFGLVSGAYRLYETTSRAASWTNVSALTSATFIRSRRNDNTAAALGSSKGQLYVMANSVARYSSKWATNGTFPRNMPTSGLTSLESVY